MQEDLEHVHLQVEAPYSGFNSIEFHDLRFNRSPKPLLRSQSVQYLCKSGSHARNVAHCQVASMLHDRFTADI